MSQVPASVPGPDSLRSVFAVYDVSSDGSTVEYVGDPLVPRSEVLERVRPAFSEAGYDVDLTYRDGHFVLVAAPKDQGVPWTNVLLFVATVVTTIYAGTGWYYVRDVFSPAVLQAIPFSVAVLAVLGTHELGHYVMTRYHDVDASLPYFIPMLPPFGTWGAVIKMRGTIPDREALFDIGAAGPIAGLLVAVPVTVVGLWLPPVRVPDWVLAAENAVNIELGYPLLLQGIAWAMGEQLSYANPRLAASPVVLGGWIGMFVTFLNLIPVGQLDGGHVLRAALGPRQETVAAAVPAALFGLAAYLAFVRDVGSAAGLWVVWGVLTAGLAYVGPATPVDDSPLGWKRKVAAALLFLAFVVTFIPVPIQVTPV